MKTYWQCFRMFSVKHLISPAWAPHHHRALPCTTSLLRHAPLLKMVVFGIFDAVLLASTLFVLVEGATCPPNYETLEGRNMCYRLVLDEKVNEKTAIQSCKDQVEGYPSEGFLATIPDDDANEWVSGRYQAAASNTDSPNVWFGLYNTDSSELKWRDGGSICKWTNAKSECGPDNFWMNWEPGFPESSIDVPSFVSLNPSGRLTDKNGGDTKFFFCQYIPASFNEDCPTGYTRLSGVCYWVTVQGGDKRNAEDAESFCQQKTEGRNGQSNLATMRSDATIKDFDSLVERTSDYYIGLYSQGNGEYRWRENPAEIFKRAQLFWDTDEPKTTESCYSLDVDRRKWRAEDCKKELAHICQSPLPQTGLAYLVPGAPDCSEMTTQSLEMFTKSMVLMDKKEHSCIYPFATNATNFVAVITFVEYWRGSPTINIVADGIDCTSFDRPMVYLELGLPIRRMPCYGYIPPDGVDNSCFYKCDLLASLVNFILVHFPKRIPNMKFCEVYIE